MQTKEYQNIFKNEETHFYYVGIHQTIISFIKKFLNKKEGVKILDAGCGTGFLAKKLSIFGQVQAVDISQVAADLAKKRGVKVKIASVTKLPYKSNSFDLVVSIDVLYHKRVDDVPKALLEFYRVLKPQGVLILKNPAYNWLRGSHDNQVHTKNRFTVKETRKLLEKANFKNIKLTYVACFLLPIAIFKRVVESVFLKDDTYSDVVKPLDIINTLFITLFKIEAWVLQFVNIPFGLSVLSVSKKI